MTNVSFSSLGFVSPHARAMVLCMCVFKFVALGCLQLFLHDLFACLPRLLLVFVCLRLASAFAIYVSLLLVCSSICVFLVCVCVCVCVCL